MKYLKYFIPIWGLFKLLNTNSNIHDGTDDNDLIWLTLLGWYQIASFFGIVWLIIKLIQFI